MRRLVLFALAVLSCGCSSLTASTLPVQRGTLPPVRSAQMKPWISKDFSLNAPLVYVTSYAGCGGCVLVFRQDSGALVAQLASPISHPAGLAVDPTGNVFVGDINQNGNTYVWIFPAGSILASDALWISGVPTSIAIADDGTVYVSNARPTATVLIYPRGARFPSAQLFDNNAVVGYGVAVDDRGNVYWGISTRTGYQVDKFVHGSTKSINLGIALQDVPQELGFDKQGDLLVSQPNLPAINVYELPNTLSQQFDKTGTPMGFALNKFHSIFVADAAATRVEQYVYPSGTLIKTIAPPNFNPIDVAVYPRP